MNRDPLGERGGLNVYAFVGNDGVNKWDYLGREVRESSDIGGIKSDLADNGYAQYRRPGKDGQIITTVAKCNVIVFLGHGIDYQDDVDPENDAKMFENLPTATLDETSDIPVTVMNQTCSSAEVYGCNSGDYASVANETPGAVNPTENVGGYTKDFEGLWNRAIYSANNICKKGCCPKVTVRFVCMGVNYKDFCGRKKTITCKNK